MQDNFSETIMQSLIMLSLISIIVLLSGAEGNSSPHESVSGTHFTSAGASQCTGHSTNVSFKYVVFIDSDNKSANDSQSCHPPKGGGNSSIPCKSLDYALKAFETFDLIMFFLTSSNGTYFLNSSHRVIGRNGWALYGNDSLPSSLPAIECGNRQNGSGLLFWNSRNIVMNSVRFFHCGAIRNSSSIMNSSFVLIRASLYFYNCTNVRMDHVQVLGGSKATGLVMYDTDGVVELSDCTFEGNKVDEGSTQPGGGGAAIEFTYCHPGDNTCNNKYDSKYKKNKCSTYSIKNCTFKGNRAQYLPLNGIIDNVALYRALNHDNIGKGGGLSVSIQGDARGNKITIDGCHFIDNAGQWGGGLHVKMGDNSTTNEVLITGDSFVNNSAYITGNDTGTGGGGIDIYAHVHYDSTKDEAHFNRSKIHVLNCGFTQNRALDGGALYVATVPENVPTAEHLTEIVISGSVFKENAARLGSAVVIIVVSIFNDGYLPKVEIRNCNFSSNRLALVSKSVHVHSPGYAIVYISKMRSISFRGKMTFYNNNGSSLVLVGTQVDFTSCTAVFQGNVAEYGAGINLLGDSSLLIGPDTDMKFVNNTASFYGAAIYNRYVSNEDLLADSDCFIRYNDSSVTPENWKAKFLFSGNKALRKNCSIIFSTSLFPCLWTIRNSQVEVNAAKVFHWNDNWVYENSSSQCETELHTEASDFTFQGVNDSLSNPIPIFPGQEIILPISAWDDLGQNVTNLTIYSAEILQTDKANLAEVTPGFSYIASNLISITGEPGHNVTLKLQTEGLRTKHVTLYIEILNCPPGFLPRPFISGGSTNDSIVPIVTIGSPHNDRCTCPETDKEFQGYIRCDFRLFKSQIEVYYWFGAIGTTYVVGSLPEKYYSDALRNQSQDNFVTLPNTTDELDAFFCGGGHRTDVLCGKCQVNYSVAINSPNYQCVLCNSTVSPAKFVGYLIGYILLTFVPIALFIVVIIFFNINLATSALAGFVLYAQVISSGFFDVGSDAYSSSYETVQTVYNSIYGILNLESFAFIMTKDFCVSEHLTTLDVLCIDYVIAAFPLTVILLIHMCYKLKSRKYRCTDSQQRTIVDPEPSSATSVQSAVSKRVKKIKFNFIHAYVAFIMLSYTKFCLSSMKTVISSDIFDENGTVKFHRVYLAGHLSFSQKEYLFPYGILAIFILIFIVFLPPLLLLGPLQFVDWLTDKQKFKFLQKCWPTITIHILMDTLQGYRPKRRYFAGLYLLFRLIVYLTYSFAADFYISFTVQQTVISIYIVLVALLRPYTNELHNYVDTLLFLNLGILNAMTMYTYGHPKSVGGFVVKCILIFLPLIYIICYGIWSKCHKKEAKRQTVHRLSNPVKGSRAEERERLIKQFRDDPFDETLDYSSEDPDEEMFRRAERGNRFKAMNVETEPPKRPGEVPRTVISIPDPELPNIKEEEEDRNDLQLMTSDSGIGRQSREDTKDSY